MGTVHNQLSQIRPKQRVDEHPTNKYVCVSLFYMFVDIHQGSRVRTESQKMQTNTTH